MKLPVVTDGFENVSNAFHDTGNYLQGANNELIVLLQFMDYLARKSSVYTLKEVRECAQYFFDNRQFLVAKGCEL